MTKPPPIKLTEPPDNTLTQCDAAFGAYLRAWDQVESRLLPLFTAMLGTHQNAALVLLGASLPQPTLREILQALASIRLSASDQQKLKALLRRWKSASSKRNRIVHGHWMLSIKMVKGPSGKEDHTKSTWVRFYPPADPTIYPRIFGGPKPDKKLIAEHVFRLEDIAQAAKDVQTFATDFGRFIDQMSVLPFLTPQPINIDQSAIQTPTKADGD